MGAADTARIKRNSLRGLICQIDIWGYRYMSQVDISIPDRGTSEWGETKVIWRIMDSHLLFCHLCFRAHSGQLVFPKYRMYLRATLKGCSSCLRCTHYSFFPWMFIWFSFISFKVLLKWSFPREPLTLHLNCNQWWSWDFTLGTETLELMYSN